MDVASWLRSLGLEQYEATFRENAIDDSVLPDLTDQDQGKVQQARELLAPVYGWLPKGSNARSEGGEGAAGRVGGIGNRPITFWRT